MAHATADLDIREEKNAYGVAPIDDAVHARLGTFALLDSAGNLDPDNGIYCAGVVDDPKSSMEYDNSSSDSIDPRVSIAQRGVFGPYTADVSAAPDDTMRGAPLFAKDNQTPSLQPFDADGTVRPYVGKVDRVETAGLYIDLDPAVAPAIGQLRAYRVAPLQTMEAADVLVVNAFQDEYPVVGDSAPIVSTADLPAGSYDGQRILIRGTDSTNTLQISDATNVRLQGDVAAVLGAGDVLLLEYDGDDDIWNEISRSMN